MIWIDTSESLQQFPIWDKVLNNENYRSVQFSVNPELDQHSTVGGGGSDCHYSAMNLSSFFSINQLAGKNWLE